MKRSAIVAIALAWMVCLSGMASSLSAAWASTWADANSNWNNSGHWNPIGVPNSATTDVAITNGSTVTLDLTPTNIQNLLVGSGNILATNPGVFFTVNGTSINNAGQIILNGGGGFDTALAYFNNVTLQGGGGVTLRTFTGGGNASIFQAAGGIMLTNVDNTIQGSGRIASTIINLTNQAGGVINANSAGGFGGLETTELTIAGATITNAGLLEATNRGVLQFANTTVNNAGGRIEANGANAAVQFFNNSSIRGGTLNSKGLFLGTPAGGTASLDGSTGAGPVTMNGTYTSDFNSATHLVGTINNMGKIQVNGGSGNNSFLVFDTGNLTLQGGGAVTLNTLTGGGNASIFQGAPGITLTNVDNTIQGSGLISSTEINLVNQAGGVINANSTGGARTTALTIQGAIGAAITNAGLMEATNSGVLQLSNATVNNAGGRIEANGANATVQFFNNTSIQGGTLTNNGGAFLGTPSGFVATLEGMTHGPLTLNGTYTSDFNTNTNLLGTINNRGNNQVKGGAGTNSVLVIDGNVSLQGGAAP